MVLRIYKWFKNLPLEEKIAVIANTLTIITTIKLWIGL